MQTRLCGLHILAALALLSASGCYSYSPYGYGNYRGPYFAPPAGAFPQPGSPQMGPGVPQGAYLPPQAVAPVGIPRSQWQQPLQAEAMPHPAAKAPASGDEGDVFAEPATNGPVPEPSDAGESREPADPSGSPTDSGNPFGSADSAGVELKGIDDRAIVGSGHLPESRSGNDRFQKPVSFQPVSSVERDTADTAMTVSNRPNPYKHDRNGYAWLRGVVDYDEQDQAWHLIYALNPDPTDPYGGDVTLVDSAELDALRNEDVVYVEGSVDSSVRDRLGKPCYRVNRFQRLVPKQSP